MIKYARVDNGVVAEYPILESHFRLRFPNISFPIPFVPPEGYYEVYPTPKPEVNVGNSVQEEYPVFNEEGKLVESWKIVTATPEEIEERQRVKWEEIRRIRDMKLMMTDYTQLPDSPVDRVVWAEYRQRLRDVPQSKQNPFEIVWPEEPTES